MKKIVLAFVFSLAAFSGAAYAYYPPHAITCKKTHNEFQCRGLDGGLFSVSFYQIDKPDTEVTYPIRARGHQGKYDKSAGIATFYYGNSLTEFLMITTEGHSHIVIDETDTNWVKASHNKFACYGIQQGCRLKDR